MDKTQNFVYQKACPYGQDELINKIIQWFDTCPYKVTYGM